MPSDGNSAVVIGPFRRREPALPGSCPIRAPFGDRVGEAGPERLESSAVTSTGSFLARAVADARSDAERRAERLPLDALRAAAAGAPRGQRAGGGGPPRPARAPGDRRGQAPLALQGRHPRRPRPGRPGHRVRRRWGRGRQRPHRAPPLRRQPRRPPGRAVGGRPARPAQGLRHHRLPGLGGARLGGRRRPADRRRPRPGAPSATCWRRPPRPASTPWSRSTPSPRPRSPPPPAPPWSG